MDKKNKNLNVPNLRFKNYSEEWKKYKVSDLLKTYPTNSLSWEQLSYENVSKLKDIHYGLIHNGFETTCINLDNKLIPYISSESYPKNYEILQMGDLILADASEDREDVGRPIEIVNIHDQDTISGLHTIHARNKTNLIENGFKGFYFQSHAMKNQIYKIANGSKIYGMSPTNFNELFMCIPCKSEQRKIIFVLSKLEEMIQTQIKIIKIYSSLMKAISSLLFSKIETKKQLSEICVINKGKQINGEDLLENGPYYMMNGGTSPSGYLNIYNKEANMISISEGGNSCGYVQFNNDKFWSGGHCYTIENIKPTINNKFLYYYLKYNESKIMNLRIGTGLPNIQKKDLEQFKVAIPNFKIQIQITHILNCIETKLNIEKELLTLYQLQKSYLLKNMFI